MNASPPSSRSIGTALSSALRKDSAAGILLILVAALAILVANSPLASAYHGLFHAEWPWTPIARLNTLHAWINDGLMAVFFLVVGLEIKREMLVGELSCPDRRRLPILAAALGMAVPALIYLAIAGPELPLQRGWAIPAATDIAFAVGVIGLLGRKVPASLRLFLLTVAIVDDLGAVAIIAVFYTATIDLGWILAALLVLAALIGVGRRQQGNLALTIALSLILWFCVLNSGIHATIAGVAAAFAVPLQADSPGQGMPARLEQALEPWSRYLVVPLFGFANAGVALSGTDHAGLRDSLPLAIAAGLFAGKQIGIFAAIALAQALGLARRPQGASWLQVWGMAILCGIGFTMSLFIAGLAFPGYPHLVEEAKLGILGGSLLSALLGYVVLRMAASRNVSSRQENGSS